MATKQIPLYRYTQCKRLEEILAKGMLTLITTSHWEDSNDKCSIEKYKSVDKLSNVFALCFTEANETYHHWRCFAGQDGKFGVRIAFKREMFFQFLREKYPEVMFGNVKYYTVTNLKKSIPRLRTDELPFLKRYPYRDEKEVRLIYPCRKELIKNYSIKIPLEMISRISLSPWMDEETRSSVRSKIIKYTGNKKIQVTNSKLLGFSEWMNMIERFHA